MVFTRSNAGLTGSVTLISLCEWVTGPMVINWMSHPA
jgi:hypothetical protein